MIGAVLWAVLQVGSPSQDLQGAVTIRQQASRVRPFVGEQVTVDVVVTLDAAAEAGLVPLFRRPLDLQMQVELPWLEGAESWGAQLVEAGDGKRVAVAGEPYAAEVQTGEDGGRSTRRVRVRARLLASSTGELLLAAPRVRWAYASDFETDLFGNRRAVDRRDVVAEGKPLLLDVRPLPTVGRPESWTGAVGRFEVAASLDRDLVADGAHLELVVRVTGEGDLQGFAAPRLDALAGFDVVGRLERPAADARVFIYELAPRVTGAVVLEAIEFPYFDPTGDGAWQVARSAALPVTVRGTARSAAADGLPPLLRFDAQTVRDRGPSDPSAPLWGGLLLPWVVGVLVWARRYLRRRAELPVVRMRRTGRRMLHATAAGQASRGALFEGVAALLDAPTATVVDAGLDARLGARGMDSATARACANLVRELLAEDYGGPPVEAAGERVRAIAQAMRDQPRGGRR